MDKLKTKCDYYLYGKEYYHSSTKRNVHDTEALPERRADNAGGGALKRARGSTLCLPYLAALIRLSDEIDVTKLRNPALLYDSDLYIDDEIGRREFGRHEAIQDLVMTPDEFILLVKTDSEEVMDSVYTAVDKMQQVLDDCRHAVLNRTPFRITQQRVTVQRI